VTERLNDLQAAADTLQAESSRYTRPICLVQVERTGKEQREVGFIHAEDAREYLLTLGVREQQIAIKTSAQNDLKEPENLDLLSPTNPIRFIIRVVPLDNFMIYKDIIRLDRPD